MCSLLRRRDPHDPTVQMALRWLFKNPAHKNMNPATRHLILTRIIVELISERD